MKPGNPPAHRQEGCQFRRIIAFRKMRGMSKNAQPLKMQGFFLPFIHSTLSIICPLYHNDKASTQIVLSVDNRASFMTQ